MIRNLARFYWRTAMWRGRLSRKGLFGAIGLFYLIGLATTPVQLIVPFDLPRPVLAVRNAFLIAVGVLCFALLLGAFVRRLHDRGRQAWWLLVFYGPHIALAAVLSHLPASNGRCSSGYSF